MDAQTKVNKEKFREWWHKVTHRRLFNLPPHVPGERELTESILRRVKKAKLERMARHKAILDIIEEDMA